MFGYNFSKKYFHNHKLTKNVLYLLCMFKEVMLNHIQNYFTEIMS